MTKGKKYEIHKILPRHFIDTAKAINFSEVKMQTILNELKEQEPEAILQVKGKLPVGFPKHISDSIFDHSI